MLSKSAINLGELKHMKLKKEKVQGKQEKTGRKMGKMDRVFLDFLGYQYWYISSISIILFLYHFIHQFIEISFASMLSNRLYEYRDMRWESKLASISWSIWNTCRIFSLVEYYKLSLFTPAYFPSFFNILWGLLNGGA